MMKFITGIVAFTITFAFSVALIGFPQADYIPAEIQIDNPAEQGIASLLQRDIANGAERDSKIYFQSEDSLSFESYTELISVYVDESSSMNDADLPPDFQVAWQEHMQAWHDYVNFLNTARTAEYSSGTFAGLDDTYNREISDTWDEVLSVGRVHGVTVR